MELAERTRLKKKSCGTKREKRVRDIKRVTNKDDEYLPFRLFVRSYRLVIVVVNCVRLVRQKLSRGNKASYVEEYHEKITRGNFLEMADFNVRRSGGGY
jgi:hypothetical protein